MTVGLGAICFACARWRGGTCEAFPSGIPRDIMYGGFDHRNPHEGDGGVVFLPDPAKAKELATWEDFFKERT